MSSLAYDIIIGNNTFFLEDIFNNILYLDEAPDLVQFRDIFNFKFMNAVS